MDDKPSNPIETLFVEMVKLIWEMLVSVFKVIPVVLKFIAWVLLAVIVLPCVFVAGNIYPWWVEWGEDF
jgi:hypothetical protein